MESVSVPTGIFKRIAVWLWDLVLMPGRVAELVKSRRDELNRIRHCPNCEIKMRVTMGGATEGGADIWRYECEKCVAAFSYTYWS